MKNDTLDGRNPSTSHDIEIARALIGEKFRVLSNRRDALASDLRDAERQLRDCAAAARVFGVSINIDPTPAKTDKSQKITLVRFIREEMESTGASGITAREIHSRFVSINGDIIHQKSVGIALKRLKDKGQAVKLGQRRWAIPTPTKGGANE